MMRTKLYLSLVITGFVFFHITDCRNSYNVKRGSGKNKKWLAIGTYTEDLGWVAGKAEGIYMYEVDMNTGNLEYIATSPETINPSYVCVHPEKDIIYVVNETGGKENVPLGLVSAFSIDRTTGALEFISSVSSEGISPCHLSLDVKADYIFVANYVTGTIAMLPLDDDGSLKEASSVIQHTADDPDRQPHAHMVLPSTDGRFLYGIDLGIDMVMQYKIDRENNLLTEVSRIRAEQGAGPRQMTFHPSDKWAYVINELNGTIDAFSVDKKSGELGRIQTISTLQKESEDIPRSADIQITPSGKYLYASNRAEFNDIAIYSVDSANGRLQLAGHKNTGGKTPRNFVIGPSGELLIVANQDSDNLVVFRIDAETGELVETGISVEVPTPVCIKFIGD
ncbi:MAG: lactonase family protein [Bacteroidales bacterium]|nr:lactonase family protein [Bacteroidales bacterium]